MLRNLILTSAFLMAVFSVQILPVANAESLLGYYEFEDNYDDSTANGNNAAPSQNPGEVSFTGGFRGQGAHINDPAEAGGGNTGGSIDIPIDASPTAVSPGGLDEVTFGGWVNLETKNGFTGFMATDNGGWDRGIQMQDNWGLASGGNLNNVAPSTVGEWQYVVATFDTVDAILYVGDDDPLNSTTISSGRPDAQASIGLPAIEIGRYDNQDLDAVVDDIFVFEGALSSHKVNAIRNLRLSGLDYSVSDAATLFELFGQGGTVELGDLFWTQTAGLDATNPGEVFNEGDEWSVVLDDQGNGVTGSAEPPADSDGDGMLDIWEMAQFGDLTRDGSGDEDSDGLTDLGEFEANTNPNEADTDSDGLSDGEEVNTHMTDPREPDSDGDDFTDLEELNATPPTDPNDSNSFPPPPPPMLLGYYPFEGSYDDATINGNHAAPGQNPTEVSIVPDGFRGEGAHINDPGEAGGGNTGGTIDIPINANPNEMPAVSFGGWVNLETNNGFTGFMAIDNGGWDRGIQMQAGWGIASGGNLNNVAPAEVGEWQYVVGTFSKPDNLATLYVGDSDPMNQTTTTGMRPDGGINPGELVIEVGRYDNQDLDAFVDDLFVFEGSLGPHQANAIRNLRLSGLDLSPSDASEVFDLFYAGIGGAAGGLDWTRVSGLDPTNPGEVFDIGGSFAVVLDDAGNGMSARPSKLGFAIMREPDGSLTLVWDSRNGKLYNVRSTTDPAAMMPIDWPVFDGNADIEATPPLNTLNISLPVETSRYFVIEEFNAPPVVVLSDDLESGEGEWETGSNNGGATTVWALGIPQTVGPSTAHSPDNCFGTNIDDNYEAGADIWLRSPVLDLTEATQATLRYFQFKDIEEGFDFASLRVLDATDNSELAVMLEGIDGVTADWEQVTRRLPAEAIGKSIKLEFRFQSDDLENFAGWYIDDVEVTVP